MAKLLVSCFFLIFGSALATVETNKRGGHGLFRGLENGGGKSSWIEESKVDTVKISRGNTNSLLSNTDSSSKQSSLFLQPEPRGLEYLLDVPDQNPLLMNFFRKRDVSDRNAVNKIRKTRQINLQPGYTIPGSRGQAVLYGVPNGGGSQAFGAGQQPFINNQRIPSGPFQNGGPQGSNGNSYYGNGQQPLINNQGIPSGTFQNGRFPQRDANTHFGGYQTYGY